MRILSFDTETTGLIKPIGTRLDNQPHIIELCAILFDYNPDDLNLKLFDSMEFDPGGILNNCEKIVTLINPGVKITKEITNITGIRNKDINHLDGWLQVNSKFSRMVRRAHWITAHNLPFDRAMIGFETQRIGHLDPFDTINDKAMICTVENTEHLRGFRLSLSALHETLFGKKPKKSHRALDDVLTQIRCFLHLKERNIV